MTPLSTIIDDATGDDGVVDLTVANTALAEALGGAPSAGDAVVAAIKAQRDINTYLMSFMLSVADEVGGLENPIGDELATFEAYLDFAMLTALYVQKEAAETSNLTVVTGEVPPL